MRFDEKSFLNTFLGFTLYWDSKPTIAIHADSPGLYTSDKILILITIDKFLLKTDVIDGSIVNCSRQAILFSFVLKKACSFKVFCELETICYKKLSRFVLNTIKFYLEDDYDEEVSFNRETLTFTLQMMRIYSRISLCSKV